VTELLVDVGAHRAVETVLARSKRGGAGRAAPTKAVEAGCQADVGHGRGVLAVVQRLAAEHGPTSTRSRARAEAAACASRTAGGGVEGRAGEATVRRRHAHQRARTGAKPERPAAGETKANRFRVCAARSGRAHMDAARCARPRTATTIVGSDFSACARGGAPPGLTYLPIVARCVIDALRESALNATLEGTPVRHAGVEFAWPCRSGTRDGPDRAGRARAHGLSAEDWRRIADSRSAAPRALELTNDEVTGGRSRSRTPALRGDTRDADHQNQPVAILDLEAVASGRSS